MPQVICAICGESFSGFSSQDMWDKARKHEDKYHQEDLHTKEYDL